MEDLEPFYPNRMAGRVLGMGDVLSFVEKAQEVVSFWVKTRIFNVKPPQLGLFRVKPPKLKIQHQNPQGNFS